VAASTVDRVRATLRSALNAAVREGLIAANPLAQVRLDKPVRPHPVIWTDERVEAWRRDGVRPPVAVWTLPQLVTFLTGVEKDRLAALWWLVALRGLRAVRYKWTTMDDCNGECCSMTWVSNDSADLGVSDPRAYRRLAAAAREQISAGKLRRGKPLPSITVLSRDHGHARQTCSKAYRMLEAEGLVRRFPGLGYFVLLRSSAGELVSN